VRYTDPDLKMFHAARLDGNVTTISEDIIMHETVVGIFSSVEQAHHATIELEHQGVSKDRIGYLTGDPDKHTSTVNTAAKDVTTGIEAGVVTGGAIGFLMGVTAFAIPIVGPVIAAGTIAATLSGAGIGAVAGGLIGSLSTHGLSPTQSEIAAGHIKRGGSLLTVQTSGAEAVTVKNIIEKFGGSTEVDDIPDLGSLPSDPLDFSGDFVRTQTEEDPISELGSSRQSRY
jgi:uncharacterized membrane protein